MNWQQVCDDSNLQNLPYKIELNERGQVLMSPARLIHSGLQAKIIKHLILELGDQGEAIPEFALKTPEGTKVPDVVWCSQALWDTVKHRIESDKAPEICIEVLSPSNTESEMEAKQKLYFAQGAKEFWVCTEEGTLTFFDPQGSIPQSKHALQFPKKINI